ncbi:MAG: hypothetical protein MSS71_08780 [Campylobacter sp.]|uniref:hypothetical protein n=1 Tax=Campylobacter sp. TaxID=205 RepID=UPI002AA904E7|nr:hypothetical protein [Campylobacter sp.]MCI7587926.1 hypothetical protein [Campylobacter sp.]
MLRIRWLGVRGYFLFRNSRICLGILEFLGFKLSWLSAAGAAFMRLLPVAVIAALRLRATYKNSA